MLKNYIIRGQEDPAKRSAFVCVGLTWLGTSLLPQLGEHLSQAYTGALMPIGLAAPIIVLCESLFSILSRVPKVPFKGLMILAGLCVTGIVAIFLQRAGQTRNITMQRQVFSYIPDLGFKLPPTYAAGYDAPCSVGHALEAAGVPSEARLQSTYPSATGLLLAAKPLTAFGADILALGPENRFLFTEIIAPGHVAYATSVFVPLTYWQYLDIRASWAYFRALNLDHRPIAQNDNHIFWKRRTVPLPNPSDRVACIIDPHADDTVKFSVEMPSGGRVELHITLLNDPPTRRGAILTAIQHSPYTRVPNYSAWGDAPRYGLPSIREHRLFMPIARDLPSRITLAIVGAQKIDAASFTASLLFWPATLDLPRIEDHFAASESALP